MAQEESPEEFYERILNGSDHYKEIVLPHKSGSELHNVRMTVVPKGEVADEVGKMPDELFEGNEVDDVDDVDLDEAKEVAREQQGNASGSMDGSVIRGFETLCKKSLEHDQLSESQMDIIIEDLSFGGVIELGLEVLQFSIENSGDVEGFREQS